MSNKKEPPVRPNPEGGVLGLNTEDLVKEWQTLSDTLLQQSNTIKQNQQLITMSENNISQIKEQQLSVIGKLEILGRIFNGLGVDPNNFEPVKEKSSEKFPPKKDSKSLQVVENKEDK